MLCLRCSVSTLSIKIQPELVASSKMFFGYLADFPVSGSVFELPFDFKIVSTWIADTVALNRAPKIEWIEERTNKQDETRSAVIAKLTSNLTPTSDPSLMPPSITPGVSRLCSRSRLSEVVDPLSPHVYLFTWNHPRTFLVCQYWSVSSS